MPDKKEAPLREFNPEGRVDAASFAPIEMELRKPVDHAEHFRKKVCAKGHTGKCWDENQVKYSQDHRTHILFCKECEKWYIMPMAGIVSMDDKGFVSSMGRG